MNSCINFSKTNPIMLIVLTLAFVYGLMHLAIFLPSGPMKLVAAYIVFTLIVVPSIVRCIKNVKSEEAIPFDENFLPRDVEFEKKTKKKK